MEKYSKQIIITIILLFSLSLIGWRYLLGRRTPVGFIENNSYSYEDFQHQLQSEGIIIKKIQNNNILYQIFPKSKIWQYTNQEGQNLYLADGEDKTEINVINNQLLTDKIVGFNSVEIDFDRNGDKELVTFTTLAFKDTALCCNLKRFLTVFGKNRQENWRLIKEKELDVFHGGKQSGKIRTVTIRNLAIVEIIIDGDYYNGLKTSSVSWFIWQQEDFKQIWREHLVYNTDIVGTFPEETMDNYQAHYELEYADDEEYPRIKLMRIYTKKQGKNLIDPDEKVIYYLWNQDRQSFNKV